MTGLKFSQRKDGTLEVRGLGIPFGGPINGKDLHGQFFSAKTDFAWDLIPDGARPLLYQHGLDDTVKTEVVGRWGVEKVDAKGVWVRAQLSARSSYLSEIKELLTEDALGLSSATMGHLVKVNQKNGEILNWPVVELSLTPNPANPTAYVVKSMVTPARHAAKLLRVLKHGDHDQADHGNRDGAGGGGSDDKPSGSSNPPGSRLFSSARSNAEGNVRSIAEDVDKLRKDRTTDPAVRDKIGRLQDLIKRMSGEINDADPATDKNMVTSGVLSTLGKMHGQVGDIVESLQDDWVFDDLRPLLEELDNELESFGGAFNAASKKSYGRKHGDHDQSEHGNRDGASGGSSDEKPMSGSREVTPSEIPSRGSYRERLDRGLNFVNKGFGLLETLTFEDEATHGKILSQIGSALQNNEWGRVAMLAADGGSLAKQSHYGALEGHYRDLIELYVEREIATENNRPSKSLKHGDHDQSDHGNRDGASGGGSDSGDKPSGGSAPSRAGKPAWSGRQLSVNEVPRNFVAAGRPYAREALQAVEDHIKPIDPEDPDDIKAVADFKAAYEKNIKDGFSLISQGNIGGGLSEFARASSRAYRNDEPKELRKVLDDLHDRMAATFGSSDVLDEANLEKFSDVREFGARWASTLSTFRPEKLDSELSPETGVFQPKRSWKADFLNEDAEEGAPEEEANEESDTLEASIAKLVESTEYTLGEIAEALAKATDENNEVIVNCLTESQDALEKLAGELADYLEGTSPTDEVEDETETETPIASPMASLAILAGKPSRAEGNLEAVKAALSAEIRKQTLVAIGRKRDRK